MNAFKIGEEAYVSNVIWAIERIRYVAVIVMHTYDDDTSEEIKVSARATEYYLGGQWAAESKLTKL